MALSSSSTCRACLRRLVQPFGIAGTTQTAISAGTALNHQTRAKSTTMRAHDQGVVVRLLRDIPKFGREHAIFRVERGRMRNDWYPKKRAEYMTPQRFHELGLTKKDIGERDRSFMPLDEFEIEPEIEFVPAPVVRAPVVKPVIPMIDPEVFRDTVSTAIPETLAFFRKAIPPPPPPPEAKISPLIASQKKLAVAEKDKLPIGIFGSVSAADVVDKIKELLSMEPELGALKLEPQHIKFLGLEEDADRLKTLGWWEVEISIDSLVPGGNRTGRPLKPIVKMVEVLPEK